MTSKVIVFSPSEREKLPELLKGMKFPELKLTRVVAVVSAVFKFTEIESVSLGTELIKSREISSRVQVDPGNEEGAMTEGYSKASDQTGMGAFVMFLRRSWPCIPLPHARVMK